MDKAQALYEFWSSFGLPAYDANTVPDNAEMPYITYDTASDSFDNVLYLNASLWYKQMSWEDISKKADEISKYLFEMNPLTVKIDGGRMYIARGTPFAQRMSDVDDMIRRIVLSITVEFFTAY